MNRTRQSISAVLEDFKRLHQFDSDVTVALSGGVDSVAMLFCLSLTKATLKPVFVYHHMRSRREEDLSFNAAKQAAEKCGLSIISCNENGMIAESEESARNIRYQCLATLSEGGTIATAHHADDQLETMLMRLCRGSGIQGLSAIPASSRLPIKSEHNCRVIRPMLRLCKDDCLDIVVANNLPFYEDHTNTDLKITRNRIRHEVIPTLKSLYPNAAVHASEAAFKLRDIAQVVNARIDIIRSMEVPTNDGMHIETSKLREETDSAIGAYFRDAAKRLNNGKKLDRVNSLMINQIINTIRTRGNKFFDWPGFKIEMDKDITTFVRNVV